jgi:hypothetical protein
MHLRPTKVLALTFDDFDIEGRLIFENVHEFQEFQEKLWDKFDSYLKAIYSDDYYEVDSFTPGKVGWEFDGDEENLK